MARPVQRGLTRVMMHSLLMHMRAASVQILVKVLTSRVRFSMVETSLAAEPHRSRALHAAYLEHRTGLCEQGGQQQPGRDSRGQSVPDVTSQRTQVAMHVTHRQQQVEHLEDVGIMQSCTIINLQCC